MALRCDVAEYKSRRSMPRRIFDMMDRYNVVRPAIAA
jgi:hypothetical protein